MPIAIIVKNKGLGSEIRDRLTNEGVEHVFPIKVNEILYGRENIDQVDLVFLVLAEQEIVNAGDWTDQIRRKLSHEQKLVLCMPHSIDPQLLLSQGADEIITPAGMDVERVVERILGHLIQKKRIEPYSYESLYGATKPMRELYNRIGRYAPKDEPLLLLGETGTGKELVARELHNKSGRTGAFAPINLAESNSELIADEIFGHTKGAFSGASQFRTGWIATAQNGTVFFDEIGELEPSKQVILLRVVERNQVHRVGSDHLEDVNARFIFATNQNLEERISQNLFREDLYQRIDVLRLDLPPLRIRKADIPLLVEHFVDKYGKTKSLKIMPDAFDVLFRHDWPGNVRELHHIVVKAVALLDENGVITYSLLQELIRWPKASQANSIKALQPKNAISFNIQTDTWPAILHRARGLYFKAVTEAANGSIDEAKRLSGMEKAQIYKILGEHGLSLKQKPPTRDSD